MTNQHDTIAGRDDEFYDQLVDEIAEKLALGERLDRDAYFVRYPQYAEKLRRILPAMQAIVELASDDLAVALDRQSSYTPACRPRRIPGGG